MTYRYPPATPNLQGLIDLAGDLDGYGTTASSPRVGGLQGNPIKYQILGAAQDGYALIWNNSDGYLEAEPITVSSGSVSPGTAGQVFVTNSSPIATWTSLINYETVHGRFTSGGSGSDFKTIVGPKVSAETSFAAIYLLPGATSPLSNNWSIQSDGTSVLSFNNPIEIDFSIAGSIQASLNASGSTGRWILGNALPTSSNYAIASDAGSFTTINSVGIINFAGSNITRASIETTHGKITAGGSGSDYATVIGGLVGFETSNAGIYFLPNATLPTFNNVGIYGDGSNLIFNTISAGGGFYFYEHNTTEMMLIAQSIIHLYTPSIIQFEPAITGALIWQSPATSDVVPQNLTIQAQGPYASAVTHVDAGNVVINTGASISGTAKLGGFSVAYNGTEQVLIGTYDSGNGGAIWIGNGAATPTNSNYSLYSAGFVTELLGPSSGFLYFGTGSTIVGRMSASNWLFGSFGAEQYILDVSNTAAFHFTSFATSSTVIYDQSTTGNGNSFFIRGQDGYATNPANGGNVFISSGAKNSTGIDGYVAIETGGKIQAIISPASALSGSGSGYVAVDNSGLLSFTNTIVSGGVTPGTAGQIFVTNSTPASAWTSLISYEPTHGRFQSGGSGSDFKAIIGPTPGAETTSSSVYLLPGATAPVSSNYFLHTDGTFAYVSDIYGNGMYFYSGAATPLFNANVSAITTAVNLILGAANVTWANNIASPTFSQSAAASDVAPQNLTIRAQGPYASAVTHVQAGDVIVDIPANISGTIYGGGLLVTYAGVDDLVRLGTYSNGSFGAIWFGTASAAPTSDNYGVLGDGTNTQLNAHGVVYIEHAGLPLFTLSSSTLLLGTFTAETYQFDWSATATFHFTTHATSATIVYDAQGSDVATSAFTIHAQDAWASASTHKTGGDLILKPGSASTIADQNGNVRVTLPQSSITGTSGHGFFTVEEQGNYLFRFGSYQAGSSYSVMWAQDGGSPTSANYVFLSDGVNTYFNAPSLAGALYFGVGGHYEISATHTHVFIGPDSPSGGGVAISSMYFDTTTTSPAIHFSIADTTANIVYDAQTSDVACADLTIFGQYAYSAATGTNRTPGSIVHDIGTPTNGQTVEAAHKWTRGGSEIARIATYPSAPTQGQFWLGGAAFTSSNPAITSDGSSFTYLNTGSSGALGLISGNANILLYIGTAQNSMHLGAAFGTAPFIFDWSTSTTPLMQSGSSATQLTVGTNNNSSTLFMQGGSAVTGISITAPGSTVGTATITVTGALIETTRTSAGPTLTLDTTTTDRIIFVTGSLTLTLNAAAHTNGRKVEFWVDTTVTGSNGSDITLTITPVSTEKINGINANLVITIAGNPKQVSKFTMIGNGTDILIV